VPDGAFGACFAAAPALEELRLHWSDIAPGTLAALGSACPRLARLDLRWCALLEGGAIVDLVRARQGAIEEVAVLNCPIVEERDVLELAALTVCRVTLRAQGDPCRACAYVCSGAA
jgi:hypothetical protein